MTNEPASWGQPLGDTSAQRSKSDAASKPYHKAIKVCRVTHLWCQGGLPGPGCTLVAFALSCEPQTTGNLLNKSQVFEATEHWFGHNATVGRVCQRGRSSGLSSTSTYEMP
jgi:hypothetical protein